MDPVKANQYLLERRKVRSKLFMQTNVRHASAGTEPGATIAGIKLNTAHIPGLLTWLADLAVDPVPQLTRPNVAGDPVPQLTRPNLAGDPVPQLTRPNLAGDPVPQLIRPNLAGDPVPH